jgi:citrate synthase
MVNRGSGLEGVVVAETEIGLVDGMRGHLVFRGAWAKELAVKYSFEEVAYLLWTGIIPNADELRILRDKFQNYRRLTHKMRLLIDSLPKDISMMNVLMSVVSSLPKGNEEYPPALEQAIRVTAMLPAIIAYRYRRIKGIEYQEDTELEGHTAHYLRLLFGHAPTEAQERALNAYLILAMEHGLNASTFAARVVSSTESDLFSAVGAAMGAMKGPLHGGAPSEVLTLLEEIKSKDRAEPYLRDQLQRGERLMGFGHRIYKTLDPRAEALRKVAIQMSGEDPWLDLALEVERQAIKLLEEYKPGRNLYTNVEFYAAAVMRAVRMPPELFTPTFTVARVVGWTAHILEQSQHNRIFRPQSNYVGPMPE